MDNYIIMNNYIFYQNILDNSIKLIFLVTCLTDKDEQREVLK